jgi:hypothetical protein
MGGPEASVSRQAGSLPFPGKPVGTVNEEMPFDHVVVVMVEAKWNLPALTRRDANAPTVMDFLDPGTAAFLEPPRITAPSQTGPSGPVSAPRLRRL